MDFLSLQQMERGGALVNFDFVYGAVLACIGGANIIYNPLISIACTAAYFSHSYIEIKRCADE